MTSETIAQNTASCPLCSSKSSFFEQGRYGSYFSCPQCSGIFLHEKDRMNETDEKKRYLEHNNDIYDEGYRNFVSPIVNAVKKDFCKTDEGLDFGAGPGPVISIMLKESDYSVTMFDPFFHNNPAALEKKYDYIIVCEVMEHFYNPFEEFKKLYSLLKPGGRLYCMTALYDPSINFKTWYYVSDHSHVFFYRNNTLTWIKEHMGFISCTVDKRLIIFEK